MSEGRRVWWGVILIALGLFFLLDRFGLLRIYQVWEYWPLFLILAGIGHLLWPDMRARVARGFELVLLGILFLAITRHWYGLTWHTGWPIILIIVGVSLLLKILLERGRDETAGGGDGNV
jgi:hypothetical protein